MARQMGDRPIKGTIGGINFYEDPNHGFLARKARHVDPEKVKTAESYRLTMLNAYCFQEAIFAASLLRESLGPELLRWTADALLSGRMNSYFSSIVHKDLPNELGEQIISYGDLSVLTGFEFNNKLSFKNVFKEDCFFEQAPGTDNFIVSIPASTTLPRLEIPACVTDFKLQCGAVKINFEAGTFRRLIGDSGMRSCKAPLPAMEFTIPTDAGIDEVIFVVLGIALYAKRADIPKDAYPSKNKRNQLRTGTRPDSLLHFTGALKIVQVISGKLEASSDSSFSVT